MQPDSHPDDRRPTHADGPIDLVVDDHLFQVTVRDDGGCNYSWTSGLNPGYGFSSSAPRCAWRSDDGLPPAPLPLPVPTIGRHRQAIRDFLAGIDPRTGYLSETD